MSKFPSMSRRLVPLRWMAIGAIVIGVLPLGDAGAAPSDPAAVIPLDPARILDTRHGLGTAAPAIVSPGETLTLQVTGAGGVPAGATGVVANVTVTEATGAGWVAAYPADGELPEASVINYSAGEDVANMVTAKLSPSGELRLYNAQSHAHLVVDVAGYLSPTGAGLPGPAGPQGPTGPQGPAGADAPTGLGFDEVVTVPANGTTEVLLGEVVGVAITARCSSTPEASIQFDAVGIGTIRLRGSVLVHAGGGVIGATPPAGAGPLVVSATSPRQLVATLRGTQDRIADVNLSLAVESGVCVFVGSIAPV